MIRNSAKTAILIVIVSGLAGAVAWYFIWGRMPTASFEELRDEFDRDFLSTKEHALLNAFVAHFKQNAKDSAVAVVMASRFAFRGIFEKTVQNALWLRYKGKPDSAEARMALASEIAGIYDSHLDEKFLRREFEFCNGLAEKRLQRKLTVDFLYNKGQNSLGQKDYPIAQDYYEKSLKLSRKIDDARREVDNLLKIQYFSYAKGSHYKALSLGRETLDFARHIGYRYREAWALFAIGTTLFDLGEYKEALKNLETGLTIAQEINDQKGMMSTLERIGVAARRLGEFSKVLAVYNESMRLSQIMGDKNNEVRLHNGLGLIYKNLGNYTKALEELKKAYELAKELRDYNEALALLNLGELYRLLGDYDNAFEYSFKALKLNYQAENYYDIALTQKCIGDVYQDQKNYQGALEYFQNALKEIEQGIKGTKEVTPQRLESEIWLSIGDLHGARKEWQLAQESYRKAFITFKKIEFQEGIVQALTRIGNALRELKEYKNSLEHFNEGVNAANKLKDPLLLSNVYYGIGLTHRDHGKFDDAEQAFTSAINVVDATREKIIGDERINYFATVQDIYDEMILLHYNQANYPAAFDFSERSRARAFLDFFQETARNFSSNTANESMPPMLSEIQKTLDTNVQLIEYKVTKNKLIIIVIDRDSLKHAESQISRDELSDAIFEFRRMIGADQTSEFNEKVKKESKEVYNRSVELAKKLYSVIMTPIKNKIASDKIIYIVPDDVLFYLPFAALVSPEDRQGRFFIQEFTIAYVSSAAILKYCLDHKKSIVPPSQLKLLAVGNPTFDLPASAKEARKIASMFSKADTLIGVSATEDAVLRAMRRGPNIIHFATHAFIDEKSPLFSYLVLGRKADPSRETISTRSANGVDESDNLLMAHEVFNLNLSEAKLVTLSACRTAGGRLFRGEGIVGMTRAFMKAGTPSVITSLWDIGDKYTEEMMIAFYNNWKTEGRTKVQALADAQRKIIADMFNDRVIKYPHPYAWAAFTLTGDYH